MPVSRAPIVDKGIDMNEASQYLRKLAEQVAAACIAHAHPRAILLTGSAAEGESDEHSDIDLITYFDELPSSDQVRTLREEIGSVDVQELGRTEEAFGEDYYLVGGVQCQVLYTTISAWEQEMRSVLEQFDTSTTAQKALEGLLRGVPLYGADLIKQWQIYAQSYPDGLAKAMVQSHLHFFPIWRVQKWVAARDMTLCVYETLVESSYHILSILAGLNRLYFSSFRFKRQRQFIKQLRIAPHNLAERLENLFKLEYVSAVAELERLIEETVTLVEAQIPEIDTSRVRHDLGKRRAPWTIRHE
jgi:predicted nucleotidyltransferase